MTAGYSCWESPRHDSAWFLLERKLLITAAIWLLSRQSVLVAGQPWGVVYGLGLWVAKGAQSLGWDSSSAQFWIHPINANALSTSILTDTTSLVTSLGLIGGAACRMERFISQPFNQSVAIWYYLVADFGYCWVFHHDWLSAVMLVPYSVVSLPIASRVGLVVRRFFRQCYRVRLRDQPGNRLGRACDESSFRNYDCVGIRGGCCWTDWSLGVPPIPIVHQIQWHLAQCLAHRARSAHLPQGPTNDSDRY